MAKVYTKEELNSFSRETLMAVILSMQDQISQLNTNMERLIEQIADANNKRYGRSSEKLETISGQMELELIFNEAEALTETLYVVEPAEEDVIQPRHRKSKKYSGVRPHKEKINISKEIINKTRGAVAPYAAQIFTHLSVVSSRQRSYDWLRCEGLKNEMEM